MTRRFQARSSASGRAHLPEMNLSELELQIKKTLQQNKKAKTRADSPRPSTSIYSFPVNSSRYNNTSDRSRSTGGRNTSCRHASTRSFSPLIARSSSPPRGRRRTRRSSFDSDRTKTSFASSVTVAKEKQEIRGACICGHCDTDNRDSSSRARRKRSLRSPSPGGTYYSSSQNTTPRSRINSFKGRRVMSSVRSLANNLINQRQRPPSSSSSCTSTPTDSHEFDPLIFTTALNTSVLKACLSGKGWDGLCPRFRSIYQFNVEQAHAHCQNPDCAFQKCYIERAYQTYQIGGRPDISLYPTPGISQSQAILLGRHEECTCPITRTAPGEPPSRPDHEKIVQELPLKSPVIITAEGGRYLLLDHQGGTWYILDAPEYTTTVLGNQGSDTLPSVLASGKLNPLPAGTPIPRTGITCPCYDEVHGPGSSLAAQALASSQTPTPKLQTGYTTSEFSNDIPGAETSKEYHLGKARTVLERKYLAAFPWLDRRALDKKVKQDCCYLAHEYRDILRGNLTDDEIVEFYGAGAFVDVDPFVDQPASHDNDAATNTRRVEEAGVREEEVDPASTRAILTLEQRYIATFPWMPRFFINNKARYDALWLQSQAIIHSPMKTPLADREIIEFFGAEK